MYKTVKGYCELQKKNVEVMIECIPANTHEGSEYAKTGWLANIMIQTTPV